MRGLMGALAAPGRKDALTLDQLPGFLMNVESRTGVSVTWATALQVTTMFATARVIGEDIAASRCYLQSPRAGGTGWDLALKHPLYRLLYLEPMQGVTAFTFWETIVFHVMFVGNAFVFVNRTGGGIFELILLDPGKVQVQRMKDYSFRYTVIGDDGMAAAMPADAIWHIRGPSWNGWMGMETVKVAREALGLSLALEASHARMHRDGVKPSGTYSVEGQLTDPQHEKLTRWLKKFAAANTGDPLILDNGAKWLSQAMSGVDQQHLETRRFQIEEICRAVRVLPIMVMSSDKAATYASAEQMFLAHRMHGLIPWAGRLEQAGEVSLLTNAEKRQGMRLRFNLDEAMRADFKSRQEGRQIQRQNGVISANDWRAGEDMNPRTDPGGDQYLVMSNMAIQDGRDLPPPTAKQTAEKQVPLHRRGRSWAPFHKFDPNQARDDDGRWTAGGGAAADIGSTFSSRADMAHSMERAAEAVDGQGYEEFGIRADDLDASAARSVGDKLPPSRVWSDGDPTSDVLDGTSTIGVRSPTAANFASALQTLNPSQFSGYYGTTIYVVGSAQRGTYGEDAGERVLADARVVAVYSRADPMGGPLTRIKNA